MAEAISKPTCYNKLVLGGIENTVVANKPVSATFEIQGTDGAHLLPRMTSAEIDLLDNDSTTVIGGMQVFDTQANVSKTYIDGYGWVPENQNAVFLSIDKTFLPADINGMFAGPIEVIPTPGANKFINILEAFIVVTNGGADPHQGGGDVQLNWDVTPNDHEAIEALFSENLIKTDGESNFQFQLGQTDTILPFVNIVDTPIYITNITAPFTNGVDTVVRLFIYYRVVSVA